MSSITKDEWELEIIKLWKELNVTKVEFHFDCGGDSMGSTDFYVKTNEGDINAPDIVGYFEDVIYKNVVFYENSDGHYIGESGVVEITLIEDEEPFFNYDKISTSEWNETISKTEKVELTNEEAEFVRNYITSFNGRNDNEYTINYLQDFIMSDKQEEMIVSIINKVDDMALNLDMDDVVGDGEITDHELYSYEYVDMADENHMNVQVNKSAYITKEE